MESVGQMWLYRVFRRTLLSNLRWVASRETQGTPGVTAGAGALLCFLLPRGDQPHPTVSPPWVFMETWPLCAGFQLTKLALKAKERYFLP